MSLRGGCSPRRSNLLFLSRILDSLNWTLRGFAKSARNNIKKWILSPQNREQGLSHRSIRDLQRLIQNIKSLFQLLLCNDQRRDGQHGFPVGIQKQPMI